MTKSISHLQIIFLILLLIGAVLAIVGNLVIFLSDIDKHQQIKTWHVILVWGGLAVFSLFSLLFLVVSIFVGNKSPKEITSRTPVAVISFILFSISVTASVVLWLDHDKFAAELKQAEDVLDKKKIPDQKEIEKQKSLVSLFSILRIISIIVSVLILALIIIWYFHEKGLIKDKNNKISTESS